MTASALNNSRTIVEVNEPRLVVATRQNIAVKVLALVAKGHDVDIDLSPCGYIDTSALGMLLRVTRLAREQGRRVRIAGVSAECKELLAHVEMIGKLELAD